MTPERHHRKKHDGVPFESCARCDRDRAVCQRKIRFASWAEANEWTTELNETTAYARPVMRYPCRWCDGWHMKTAKALRDRQRVERYRRKWLAGQRTDQH